MDDKQILDLYWERSEAAISETSKKYGKYCRYIASNILHNDEDSEECVNDTYLRAWNSIPPNRPSVLKTFLGKITRNLSLDRYELLNAKKRNGGQMSLIFDEIQECIPSLDSTENIVEEIALTDILNRFLSSLSLDCLLYTSPGAVLPLQLLQLFQPEHHSMDMPHHHSLPAQVILLQDVYKRQGSIEPNTELMNTWHLSVR